MNLIGDVHDKVAVLVDDMIDTAGTITNAAKALQENGAREVYACSTHAVFSPPAVERLSSGVFQEVHIPLSAPQEAAYVLGHCDEHHSCERRESLSRAHRPFRGQSVRRDHLACSQCRICRRFAPGMRMSPINAMHLKSSLSSSGYCIMPSAEEKFRALLTRIGYQPNRAAIANAFRQDAALAEVLPWIAENITDAHILDPELRHDYASLEGRLSHPLGPVRHITHDSS